MQFTIASGETFDTDQMNVEFVTLPKGFKVPGIDYDYSNLMVCRMHDPKLKRTFITLPTKSKRIVELIDPMQTLTK